MSSRYLRWLFLLFAVLVTLGASHASPISVFPTYAIHFCTDSSPCLFGEGGIGGGFVPLPTDADFQAFFTNLSPGTQFFPSENGASADGTEIGEVTVEPPDFEEFAIPYIFSQGTVTCCTSEDIEDLIGINNSDWIVGFSTSGAFLETPDGGFGLPQLTSRSNDLFNERCGGGLQDVAFEEPIFQGIDNRGRVSTGGYLTCLIDSPDVSGVELLPVPEPPSWSFLAVSFGFLGAVRQRWRPGRMRRYL